MSSKIIIGFKRTDLPKTPLKDKLIAWYTNGKYAHTVLLLPKGDIEIAWEASSSLNTVRKFVHKRDSTIYDYLDIVVTNREKRIIEHFLLSIEGNRYDWLGVFGFVLPFRDRSEEWFCSEMIANCLKIIGYKPMWKHDPSRIDPNRLYKMILEYELNRD